MNAVQSFFKKYHAIPATNAGPQWDKATTEALIGWADGDCKVWDENADAHARIVDHMADVGNELHRRWWAGVRANQDDAIHALNASHKIFRRIGYGLRREGTQ